MKAHIIPTVLDVDQNNLPQAVEALTDELVKHSAYQVGKHNISTCPICLDTETTKAPCTIHGKGETISTEGAFIWIYQLQVGKYTVLTGERDTLLQILRALNETAESNDIYLYIGIANTRYEWSFLCKDLNELLGEDSAHVEILFGLLEPLAVDIGNMTICDIVRMTNSSLAKLGKDYCTTQKLKGDLDYNKQRNTKTIKHLTEKERAYCINDVVVGAEYLAFVHDRFTSNNKRIPLTATGFIRQLMQENAYAEDENGDLIHQATLDEILDGFPKLYKDYEEIMTYLFRGGYTHGNDLYCGEVLENIEHIDYTSDYPAQLLQHKYVYKYYSNKCSFVWGGQTIHPKQWESEKGIRKLMKYENDLGFYFTATFTNIRKTLPHTLESSHKAMELGDDVILDNGRIVSADKLTVMLTEQDFACYLRFYEWDNMEVKRLNIGIKKPLPDYVIQAIVTAYTEKKRLKDLKLPYAVEKALLNAVYGCTCQRIPIADEKDIITSEGIRHIKSPVKFKYLDLDNKININYFRYIREDLIKKYKYPNTQNLHDAILRIYKDLGAGVPPRKDNPTYMAIRDAIVNKLQQRAYYEEKRGKRMKNGKYKSKMLSPFFGIACTAYARRRICDMIADLEQWQMAHEDIAPRCIVVYYDTDSLFLNCHQSAECWEGVKAIIDKYNVKCTQWNRDNLRKYDNSGRLDDIGGFDWERPATHFKQLGAKRYLQRYAINRHRFKFVKSTPSTQAPMLTHAKKLKTEERYYIESTIAGLSKKDFAKKIKGMSLQAAFAFFTDGMIFDELETSKLTPTYLTEPYEATVTDDFGNTEVMKERCGQVLKPTSFKLTMTGALLSKIRIG